VCERERAKERVSPICILLLTERAKVAASSHRVSKGILLLIERAKERVIPIWVPGQRGSGRAREGARRTRGYLLVDTHFRPNSHTRSLSLSLSLTHTHTTGFPE
jgi:hypothetical protein